jgi:hypothetical protein
LKALVLVPLPATVSHWMGGENAAAATGLAGATTGGAAGTTFAFGGAAAKVAAVVAAGAAVGGGTYEGVTRHAQHSVRTANPPAARVEPASVVKHTSTPGSSVVVEYETPKVTAPAVVEPSPRAGTQAARRTARKARSTATQRAQVTPPGQAVKAIAQTPVALRTGPPGLVAKAASSGTPVSHPVHPVTPALTRSQGNAKPGTGAAQSQSKSQAQYHRQNTSQSATPAQPADAKPHPEHPEHPDTPATSNGRGNSKKP